MTRATTGFDGDRRAQAVHALVGRTVLVAQELARVGGKGFHEAAPAFGVNRVQSQGTLARAGRARDHGQGTARDAHVDADQVVQTRAGDDRSCISSTCLGAWATFSWRWFFALG